VEPGAVADAFAKHFQSVYNNHCLMDIPLLSQSSKLSYLAPISDADICKVVKRLKLSKFVGLDDVSGFVIKGCSGIFIPVLRHIFNFSLTQQHFLKSKVSKAVPVTGREGP
jgi:hypothetical protein